jgi:hypothetical protein
MPQFAELFLRSTQLVPQQVIPFMQPVGQALEVVHLPATHCVPAAHTIVHEPQCEGSVAKSKQPTPLQQCSVPQVWSVPEHTHLLLTHVSFAPQALPQLPQLALSLVLSTQLRGELTSGAQHSFPSAQASPVPQWHSPLEHVSPSPQA